MKKVFLVVFMVGIFMLAACTPSPGIEQAAPSPVPTQAEAPSLLTPATQPRPLSLDEAAEVVINALADRDIQALTAVVHPQMGVRLSPYAYVEDSHLVFTAADLTGLVGSDEVFLWGVYDGTGDPIELTFDAYYERFLYSADFTNPEAMAVNEQLGQGNSINNIAEFYTGSSFVEYHFSGFEEDFGGMDWVSLRLVFIQEESTWYLVGLVNDQWTI